MLLDLLRHGVLAPHPGRYRVRRVDALCPEKTLPQDVMFRGQPGKLRAVFLNYLLDCLPAAALHLEGELVQQLCVRTCLARNVRLADVTDLSLAALRQRAQSSDPQARQELLEVYGQFASEYDYRPVDPQTLPYGDFAVAFGRPRSRRLLHSYGAMQCLDRLLGLLHEQGFILINDYGPTQVTGADEFEHQRFSLATFVGVNFPLLRAYFGEVRGCGWQEPPGDSRGIHSRLLGQRLGLAASTRFSELFSDAAHAQLQEPVERARACRQAGRFELAATHYQEALRQQPGNWVLLNEVSLFLIFSLRDIKAGIDLAKLALALNPTCSAELWSTLGDGLYEFGRTAEARSAYQQALAINRGDVRARYNLAWVHARERDYPASLALTAEALALDRTGEYRERLLQKQNEVLALLAQRQQQEYLLLTNLVSRHARPAERDSPGETPKPGPLPEKQD
jgi:tetratricopeptide (TPR) repeat protein